MLKNQMFKIDHLNFDQSITTSASVIITPT